MQDRPRYERIIREAVPDAIERVRVGWHLIGYDLPLRRYGVYFAYVAPEPAHVHLGFEYGASWTTRRGCSRAPDHEAGPMADVRSPRSSETQRSPP